MSPRAKRTAAFLLLIAGMFLLLEGSKLDPLRGEAVDASMMGVGAVMVCVYVYLMRADLGPGRSSSGVLMPVLLVLGVILIYQAITRALDVISRALFGSLGAVLALASAFIIYRRAAQTSETQKG